MEYLVGGQHLGDEDGEASLDGELDDVGAVVLAELGAQALAVGLEGVAAQLV